MLLDIVGAVHERLAQTDAGQSLLSHGTKCADRRQAELLHDFLGGQ